MASTPQMCLQAQTTATTASTPVLGSTNGYNATAGALSITLPLLSATNSGAYFLLQKTDSSVNTVTFTCASTDTFDDATTSVVLSYSMQLVIVQKVTNVSTLATYWKIMGAASYNTATISDTQTLTNKRVTKRVGSTASTATPTINTDSYDTYKITALATGITSWTPSGTPADRDELTITIKDNGTAQNLSWYTPGSIDFISSGVAGLPNVTSAGRKMTLKFVYDADILGWVLIAADINGY